MADLHSSFIFAFAGTSFFMFGMTLASDGLQKLAANRIRDLLGKVSDRPIMGILVGIALTVVVQSSGAVTAMMVGLGSAGVITLRQVMSLLLGTAIGTTLTVQLLSLNIAQFGLPVFSISFLVFFLANNKTLKNAMSVIMGFGLIFWGLELIGVGTAELRSSTWFVNVLTIFQENPLVAIAATAFFTAIVHSSAVTIGFAMTLAAAGSIDLADAMFWVYGANIGTTTTALLASTGGNHVGKQVAWAHCFYKLASVAVFYFVTEQFATIMSFDSPMRDVANAHTVFNILAALLFYPFINKGALLVEKMFRPSDRDKEFRSKFLDRRHFENLSVAMAHAQREVLRMGDIVYSMVNDSLSLFRNENEELEESIQERDNRVDMLHREINLFLAQFVDESNSLPKELVQLMSFASDLESVGDVIDNSLLEMARKKHALKIEFSKEGINELAQLHKAAAKVTELSLSCFQLADKELASKLIFEKRRIRKLEKSFRTSHLERLVKGKKETLNTSSIHLDVLSEYRRIVGLMTNHVYNLLKENDKYNILPRRES